MASGGADPVQASFVRRRIRELLRGGVLPAKPESTAVVPSPGGRFCAASGSASGLGGRARLELRVMGWLVSFVGVGLVLFGPVAVSAQTPTTPAHPTLPWSLGPAIPQGQLMQYNYAPAGGFIRDIWIPPQPVVVDMMVALPSSSEPPRTTQARDPDRLGHADTPYGVLRQSFVVPGYYVRETTVGFH